MELNILHLNKTSKRFSTRVRDKAASDEARDIAEDRSYEIDYKEARTRTWKPAGRLL